MDGDIVAIVSGAGLMMATVDLLADHGGTVRAAVDLGGLVLREADELADLVVAVAELRPRAVLVNAFFQLATCDALARKLSVGLATGTLAAPIVVRLRGREDDEAHRLLAPYGVTWEPDLDRACSAVVQAARSMTTDEP
jgi:succinyl-CoA synthetase beta subunit